MSDRPPASPVPGQPRWGLTRDDLRALDDLWNATHAPTPPPSPRSRRVRRTKRSDSVPTMSTEWTCEVVGKGPIPVYQVALPGKEPATEDEAFEQAVAGAQNFMAYLQSNL